MKNFKPYLNRRIDKQAKFENLLEFPKYIEIETVNACNARCPMCTINDWERNYPIMKDDVWNKISDDIIENKKFLKRVSLYRDGEPLIDKKMANRINKLYENGIRTNDIIIKINDETSNWNNLISSLRFATLGEELELNILTSSNKILNLKFETKN